MTATNPFRLFSLFVLVALMAAACDKPTAPSGTKPQGNTEDRSSWGYVPKSLKEAHEQLARLLPPEELTLIDAMKSEDEMIKYHLCFGAGLRNRWGLWGGKPRLYKHMRQLGFRHPDDMSGVIFKTFWCDRHKQEFRLEERATYYRKYWAACADPPSMARDLADGSAVDWDTQFGEGDEKTPRVIHVGKSRKTGRYLAYEHDKGVYVPDEALLKRINDSEDPGPQKAKE